MATATDPFRGMAMTLRQEVEELEEMIERIRRIASNDDVKTAARVRRILELVEPEQEPEEEDEDEHEEEPE